jgi:hypothetical protein
MIALNFVSMLSALLPAGRKFCKIIQNRPEKENYWPGKLAAYGRRIRTKAAENRPNKSFICITCPFAWNFEPYEGIVGKNLFEINVLSFMAVKTLF